jgi:hypothetical protein
VVAVDRVDGLRRPPGFAEAVEPTALAELRSELLREANHWLGLWERHRLDEHRGRLLQVLETLALVVNGEA